MHARARTARRPRIDLRLAGAVGAVWLLWGSTYAAMRFADAGIPPFAMGSIRFTLAGSILLAVSAARGRLALTRSELTAAAVTGATLLLLGTGITAYTVQFLPTGINALILSLAPVWMVAIAFVWGGERPTRRAVGGMLLGFAGLAILLQPKAGGALPIAPVLLALLAGISWAFGSIYQRRAPRARSLVLATALQMLVGGALLGVEATMFGQWQHLDGRALAPGALGGLAWLVVAGSLCAYSAYSYTMREASTVLATTYAYVNPVVAVLLGVVLFHERVAPLEAFASLVILSAVVLMVLPERLRPVPAFAAAESGPIAE